VDKLHSAFTAEPASEYMHPPQVGGKQDYQPINPDPASGRCRKSG